MDDRIRRIHLADDGSEHAAWTLHYGLRMARRLDPPHLQALHVRERGEAEGGARRAQHLALARRYGVELTHCELDAEGDVPGTLAANVPAGPQDVVIVGFRAHQHGRGLVFGSVGHALLSRHDHAVLALHVVEPGNLGLPNVLAMGLSASPGLERRLWPALQLFAGDLHELWLLRVVEVQRPFLGAMSFQQMQELERDALDALDATGERLRNGLPAPPPRIDRRASVHDRWPTQLVIDAHRVHAHMLLLGTSDHLLPSRLSMSNPLEVVLRNAACDVAVFRAAG